MFDFFKRKKPDSPPAPDEALPIPPGEDRQEGDTAPGQPAEEPTLQDAAVATPAPVRESPAAAPLSPDTGRPSPPVASPPPAEAPAEPRRSWTDRLRAGLGKSREKLAGALTGVFTRRVLDDETLEDLETALLTADVGVAATQHLIAELRERFRSSGGAVDARTVLKEAMLDLLAPLEQPLRIGEARPFVIMIAGVNGAGKTTSIGKLARYFQAQRHTVLLAAGDTFRAAAREQLVIWGERNHVPVISQAGGDPAAVMFDAVAAARSRGVDILLADTAGRLPTQLHLMDEIRKVQRVISKADASAPHETLLVLDANTGQNAVAQVRAFDEALGVTGLILTKLDGSAKGGAICAIAKERPVPLRFIGVGEGLDDLRPFVAREFVDALLG